VRAMGRACSHNPTPIATPTDTPPTPTKVGYNVTTLRISTTCMV